MKNLYKIFLLAAFAMLLASCATPRKITYLLDMEANKAYPAKPAPELRLQPEDRVSIQVLSTDPQLAAPFNATNGTTESTGSTLYTLDKEGNIDFPVLGALHLEGMTVNEVKHFIAGKIIDMGYIREPIVKVAMDNFKITVIGENNNSILAVDDESINLFQVIARTGYLGMQQRLNEVMVIRTENGARTAYIVDMQKKDLFDSPDYYLQQKVIVYVRPRVLRTNQNITAVTSAFLPLFNLGNMLTTIFMWLSLK